MAKGNKKIHYAWFIMVGCCIVMFSGTGLAFNLFSIFMNPLAVDLNLTQAQISGASSIMSLSPLLSVALANRMYSAGKIRIFTFVFGICLGGGYLILGSATSLWMVYLGSFITGLGVNTGTMLPISILITNWFDRKRGFALGIVSACSGFANMLASPIINASVENFGVYNAALIHGGVIIAMETIAFIILRNYPQQLGMMPYGNENPEVDPEEHARELRGNPTPMKELLRKTDFWKLIIGCFIVGGAPGAISIQITSIVISGGHTPAFAALMTSLFGMCMMIGKIMYGKIVDWFGDRNATYYIFVVWGLALVSAMTATMWLPGAIIMAIVSGMGCSIGSMGPPFWTNTFFKRADYSQVYSTISVVQMVGVATFSLMVGICRDLTGGSTMAFVVVFLLTIIAFFCINSGIRKKTA